MSSTLTSQSDVFTNSVTQLAKNASKQKKLVGIGAVILAAVLVAATIYLTKRAERISAGKDALFKARLTLENELVAVATALKPPAPKPAKVDPKAPPAPEAPVSATAVEGVPFDVSAKLAQSIPALEAVARDYDGISPGFDAKMVLGSLYFQHGSKTEDFANAGKWFESAAANAPQTENTVAALYGLGYAQEAQGKCDEAVKTFDKALNYGNTLQQQDLMKSQARCYETLKDTAKAKSIYEKIVATFPTSEAARNAQNKLSALGQ